MVDIALKEVYSILNKLHSMIGSSSTGSTAITNPIMLTPYCKISASLVGGDSTHPQVKIELSANGGNSWETVFEQSL